MELSVADQYSKGIKSNFGIILKAEMFLLMSANPFFNIPWIGNLAKKYLTGILDKVLENSRLFIFFKFIDMRVSDQKMGYTKSVLNYEAAKLKGDINEIESTKKIMLIEFDNFLHFNRI